MEKEKKKKGIDKNCNKAQVVAPQAKFAKKKVGIRTKRPICLLLINLFELLLLLLYIVAVAIRSHAHILLHLCFIIIASFYLSVFCCCCSCCCHCIHCY